MKPRPVYKIEVYDSVPDLIHTITSAVPMVRAKETLTGNVGTFSFTVPAKKGGRYPYKDIVSNDKVKIWFGYDAIDPASDPFLVGKIYQSVGAGSKEMGYTRTFRGRNLGEILQRRLKAMKTWSAVAASVIATEVADDLGLGKDIVEDLTEVTMTIDIDRHETYFNLLRKLSDYWFNAGTQVKKDFYVNVDDELVWQARPLRTVGVETFTVGQNINNYMVLRDIESVKNKIYVYGAKELAFPTDKDVLTEDLTLVGNTLTTTDAVWNVAGGGSTISKDADEDVGDWCAMTVGGAATGLYLTFDGGHKINANYYPLLVFRIKSEAGQHLLTVELTDTGGEIMYRDLTVEDGQYDLILIPVGRKNVNHWTPSAFNVNPFDWSLIEVIDFNTNPIAGWELRIDGLFFNNRNFYGMAEDVGSQTSYGLREMTVIDEALRSTAECVARAETILYQRKDQPIRLDLQTPGNMNVLIGDRIPMTIPAEDLSVVDFDVLTVEHTIIGGKFSSSASMINSANVRVVPPSNLRELLVREFNVMKQVAKGVLNIK